MISNASDGTARNVAWQFEQIRSVVGATFPWAKLDLARPLTVIALKDENSMRAMAPGYWKKRAACGRRASGCQARIRILTFVLRADVREEDRVMIGPLRDVLYFWQPSLTSGKASGASSHHGSFAAWRAS